MMRSLLGMEARADGHVKGLAQYLRHVEAMWTRRNIFWKTEKAD